MHQSPGSRLQCAVRRRSTSSSYSVFCLQFGDCSSRNSTSPTSLLTTHKVKVEVLLHLPYSCSLSPESTPSPYTSTLNPSALYRNTDTVRLTAHTQSSTSCACSNELNRTISKVSILFPIAFVPYHAMRHNLSAERRAATLGHSDSAQARVQCVEPRGLRRSAGVGGQLTCAQTRGR